MFTDTDFRIAIRNVDFRTIKTSDDKLDYVGKHGSQSSATYARWRQIVVEWYILASSRVNVSKGMDFLDELFALQYNPAILETHVFSVTDEQDRVWNINAKIDGAIQYSIDDDDDHNDGSWRMFRVALFAPDPRFFDDTLTTVVWEEWELWGFTIDFQLDEDFQFLSVYNSIIVNAGVNATPLKITITVKTGMTIDNPVTIYNVTQWTWFRFWITAVADDVIIIDSWTLTLTKNWTNILATREAGSIRPYAVWETEIVLQDVDGGVVPNDFDVQVDFRNSMM